MILFTEWGTLTLDGMWFFQMLLNAFGIIVIAAAAYFGFKKK